MNKYEQSATMELRNLMSNFGFDNLVLFIKKIIKQKFVGFSLVGGIVFLIGISLLALLVEVFKFDKIVANVITMVVSVEINFVLNKFVNWKEVKGNFWKQWVIFHIARAGTILFNQGLYVVLVMIGVHYLVVTVICTAVSMVINFLSTEKFVFKQEKKEGIDER